MSAWDKLVAYWKANIAQNIKKISALIGTMISTLFGTIILVIKEGYDLGSALLIIILAIQPFFYLWINLIFKGESELKDQEILQLQTRLEYQQEVAGYQIQLAAKNGKVAQSVMNVYDWNEINKKLEELHKKIDDINSNVP